jgi:glycine/D-amino acid oxidase-like deaminating enzyme
MRGLVWAPLCAEILAAQLNGEPTPVERDLAAALDPARFFLGGNAKRAELRCDQRATHAAVSG